MSNCSTPDPCNTCAPCNPDYSDTGCPSYIKDTCVTITEDIDCLSIEKNETLAEALQHMKDVICALTPTAYEDFDFSCFSTQGITTEQEFAEFIAATLCEVLGTQNPGNITSLSALYALIQSLITDVNLIKNQVVLTCFRGITGLNNPEPIGVLLGAIQTVLCDHEDRIIALEVDGSLAITANDSATIDFTASGTLNHTLTGSVKLSAVANNALTAQVDGIHVISPSITANDSATINFTTSGTLNHTLTAVVTLSGDADNILSVESDGLKATQAAIVPQDSTSVNFTASDDVTFTGVVILDPAADNILSITGSGLYANAASFGLADNSVSNSKLRDSVSYSIIGRTSGATGDPGDIQAAADEVLRRSGSGNLEFGTLVTNNIGNNEVTFAKVQNISTGKLLGRSSAGTGVVEQLSIGSGLSLSGGTLSLSAIPISYLSAATASNSIDNANYAQAWQWDTLSGVNGLKLSTASTAGSSQLLLDVRMSGARVTPSYTGMAAYFENTQTGTTGTNNALLAFASGGSANYGIVCSGAGGQWGTSSGASIYAQGRMRIDGQIDTYGSTSGIVSIKPAAIAGTWTLTLPNSAGTNGYALTTNGSGTTTWTAMAIEGTYTPTLFNTTNIAASTAAVTYYIRTGDTVTVWGEVTINATSAATISEMGMSLPVASSVTGTADLSGTGAFEDGTVVQIKGDASNTRAKWRFTPVTNTNNKYNFTFTYKVM